MTNVRKYLPIILGISLLIYGTYLSVDRYVPLMPAPVVRATNELYPTRLVIPSISVDLPIISVAQNSDGRWPTTAHGVSYDRAGARPGDMGTALMYGHNWPRLLGKLPRIQKDAEIRVELSDGQSVTYRVGSTYIVDSQNTDIVTGSGKQLIIYTCTGFLDRERFVVIAYIP